MIGTIPLESRDDDLTAFAAFGTWLASEFVDVGIGGMPISHGRHPTIWNLGTPEKLVQTVSSVRYWPHAQAVTQGKVRPQPERV